MFDFSFVLSIFPYSTLKCIFKFQLARVNSSVMEVTLAHIFVLLPLIFITPYNVLAADCLPVQIGDNYE